VPAYPLPSAPQASLEAAFDAARRAFPHASQGPAPTRRFELPPVSAPTPSPVEHAIASAARASQVDYDYLLAQAQVESAMNPAARARTSSATGLYQFIDSTWLDTMRRHGERFGLGEVSARIGIDAQGRAAIADPAGRAAVLALRSDPQIASFMAAGLAEDNRAHLAPILGREPDHGELYLAHFLGAGGAGRFLTAMAQDAGQSAAALFPKPAAANRPIFYEPGGAARSLEGVLAHLGGKIEKAKALAGNGHPIAALAAPAGQPPIPARTGVRGLAYADLSPRPAIRQLPPLGLAQPGQGRAMSNLLKTAFATPGGAHAVPGEVARAYDKLRALGF
jgi:hypothetical protein